MLLPNQLDPKILLACIGINRTLAMYAKVIIPCIVTTDEKAAIMMACVFASINQCCFASSDHVWRGDVRP